MTKRGSTDDVDFLRMAMDGEVVALCWVAAKLSVVVGFADGWVRFYSYDSAKKVLSDVVNEVQLTTTVPTNIVAEGAFVIVWGSTTNLYVFDAYGGDMVTGMPLEGVPSLVCLLASLVVVAIGCDLWTGDLQEGTMAKTDQKLHKAEIVGLARIKSLECIVSVDVRGILEIWRLDNKPVAKSWTTKGETDLLTVVKAKRKPESLLAADKFVFVVCDTTVFAFDAVSGKLIHEGPRQAAMTCNANTVLAASENDIKVFSLPLYNLRETIDSPELMLLAASSTAFPFGGAASNEVFVFDYGINKDSDKKRPREQLVGAADIANVDKVTIHTDKGDIKVKLFRKIVPTTVQNFLLLVARKYYTSMIFHRVVKGFMVQTGDPTGTGTGGESAWGAPFDDEFSPLLTHLKPYMLSMANAGPNTNASQFFITTKPAPHLDNKHTVFGEVIAGQDVVHAIERVKTKKERPNTQVALLLITLDK